MNHSTTLRAVRAPSHPLFCGRASIRSSILLSALAANRTTTTPYRRLQSSYASESSTDSPPPSSKLNPLASSRPASLELPERGPDQGKASHLLATARAYLGFYKSGLRAVFHNRRAIKKIVNTRSQTEEGFRPPSLLSPGVVPKGFTRADWNLLWRVRHDTIRLPLFGVVLLICGEFTPLIVIFVDGIVPYTCRLPRQLAASFAQAEERRHVSFADFERAAGPKGVLAPGSQGAARKHVLRSLHLPGMMWDKLGFVPPGMWATKGRLRMAFLEKDDMLLARDGGAEGLEKQEVRIACTERGIDCAGRDDKKLRQLLNRWLQLTEAKDSVERRKRMTVMLTTKTENWPKTRDFELPEWHL